MNGGAARRNRLLEDLAASDREIGLRGSFYEFVEMAWPVFSTDRFISNWHIGVIGEALEAVHTGEIDDLVVNIPPGCMKSSLVSVIWPVWSWIRDPKLSFMATSFDGDLTRRDAGYSLDIIQSEWFRERWGDIFTVPLDCAVSDHENSEGGWRFSTSVNAKATGRHPKRKVIDDPIKPKTVSPATLADAKKYYDSTFRSRGVKYPVVLIMQRLACGDLADVMREDGAHMLVLPMRHDPARSYPKDPRTKKGELLFPGLYDEKAVRKLEKMPLRDRAAQLDQNPVPEGGSIIKREWIKRYKKGERPKRFDVLAQSWDCAFKDLKTSSKVAGQVWGVAGPNFYWLTGVLDHLDFVRTCAQIVRYRADYPGSGALIEDKANGSAVMNILEETVSGIVPVEPEGGKAARLIAASMIFEGGNVWFPEEGEDEVADQCVEHLVTFPVGECDDDVDACTQLLNHFFAQLADYEKAMAGLPGGTF